MGIHPEYIAPETTWKKVYFLGIGGIGMSALARLLKAGGVEVSGYDRTPSQLTDELIAEGIPVHFEDEPNMVPDFIDLVVYTPAIPPNNRIYKMLSAGKAPMIKRSQLLGLLVNDKKLIAVAGTHGKTTVSCILANIMQQSTYKCNAILGGISRNFNSNLILSTKPDLYITEADEYDRSFHALTPWIAVVTATDADHLDIYGDHETMKEAFTQFTARIKQGGKLIVKKGIELRIAADDTVARYTYSISEPADFQAINIRLSNQYYHFDLIMPFGVINGLHLGVSGIMNLENAVAASAAAVLAGASESDLQVGLSGFKGVKRRFDHRIVHRDFVYIDDYAHHPREIEACIESVRKLYPGRKVTGVFQPHLFTRTRDFAGEFANVLSTLDEVILLDIYPARELPIEGVTSAMLLEKIRHSSKSLLSKNELINYLLKNPPEVLLTLGAGDIDRLVEPIEAAFRRTLE